MPGDWIGLQAADHAKISADYLHVRYAGADSGGNKAALNLNTDGGVNITDNDIAQSLGDGLLTGPDTYRSVWRRRAFMTTPASA